MRKTKGYNTGMKTTALFLAALMISEMAAPTVAYAISSGPSQAEFNGFTSSDSSEMVDLATGDFKYDIPLLTVPGPGGGYPLVLSYNAGAGMHDEAGWVGLGWSLNPGVINRQMRGLPDDFSGDFGDNVTKVNHIRDNMNITLGVSSDLVPPIPEIYGFDFNLVAGGLSLPQSFAMYYNTFKGLGFRVGMGAGISAVNSEFSSANAAASINLTMDSNAGAELQGNLSAGAAFVQAGTGFAYNARGGVTSVSKSLSFQLPGIPKPFYRAGGNYSTASHVPDVNIPMRGGSGALTIDVEAGAFGTHLNIPLRIEGSVAYMKVHKPKKDFKPYGYMYTHRRNVNVGDTDENRLMDYNRDNDVPINMKLPSLPVPVLTNDIYTIKGVGGGGLFRAFRNDAPVFFQPDVYTRNGGATVGLEVAAAAGFKAAVDVSGYYASAYSGKWRSDFSQLTNKFAETGNEALTSTPRTQGAFYFRMLGEKTPFQNKALYEQFDKNQPSHIGINYVNAAHEEPDPDAMADYEGDYPFSGMQKFKTGIANRMNGKPIPLFKRTVREKQTALVEYRTADEVVQAGSAFSMVTAKNVHEQLIATNNLKTYTLKTFDYSAAHIQKNHIAEFSVLQTDGSRYYYGIPAYNRSQKDNVFGSTPGGSGAGNDPTSGMLTTYDPAMTSHTSNYSRDKYVSSNELSPYAHSYLLTNIVSADYVDVSGDGPSADDYGSYTKFNYYTFPSAFKWRIPNTNDANSAISAKNFLSVAYDNKASYTYGTKEIWYLQTVETKTHIAFFITSQRLDGHQTLGENGGIDPSNLSDRNLRKLDKIILFSKKELAKTNPVALQTVDFEYSYDLCPGVPTNKGGSGGTHPDGGGDANAKMGKLTLEKVTITNQGSSKGKLTPYMFGYGATADENPAYSYNATDRWGTYRPDNETVAGHNSLPGYGNFKYRNDYNPYVTQYQSYKPEVDKQAGAWNLKAIHTPSGSTINIQYECDDYAYVQDKHAQQMMTIIGTGKADGSDDVFFTADNDRVPIRQNYRRLYFRPEASISGNHTEIMAAVARYVDNLPDKRVYFKVNELLQIPKEVTVSAERVSDYVTGYTTVESYGYVMRGSEVVPYIQIPEVNQKGKNPLRVAGLQYLRFKRADLSMTTPGGMQNVAEAVLGAVPMFFSSLEMIFGYYNWALMKGHCEHLKNDKPSFIRLNSPDGIKLGGGHRVKKISVNDGWNALSDGDEASQSYEQNFVYRTERRGSYISSGVAAYEPIHGGDENAMKYPHFYDPDNKFIHNDPAFFIEDPLPETYYPAPQVAYSRVLVYSTATETVKESGSGIAVHEFYTAKDYPTLNNSSVPDKTDDNQSTFIPFIAGIQFRNLGYSQGFSVEVNDMHGKPKAHYTYDSDNWDSNKKNVSEPGRYLTFKKYIYNRNDPAGLTSTDALGWPENYPTLANDYPNTDPGALGMDFELFSELRENSEFSLSGGAQINGGVDAAPYMWFISLMPYFEYSETGSRTVTTNKVIYRTGILTEVISYNEGNIERTRHIAFDQETGEPVLTITTSDYDDQNRSAYNKPTYSYDMPAHWYRPEMGGAYTNYRMEAQLSIFDDVFTCADAPTYFKPGDEIYCSTCTGDKKHLWVTAVNPGTFTVATRNGSSPALTLTHKITVLRSGKRNLQDAVGGNIVSTSPPNGGGANPLYGWFNANAPSLIGKTDFNYTDCFGVTYTGAFILREEGIVDFKFFTPCTGLISIPVGTGSYSVLHGIRLYQGATPATVFVNNINTGQGTLQNANVQGDCFPAVCMDGVLDASAVEYQKAYEYDVSDLATPTLNDYASGKKGIYRLVRTNAYFTTRKQSTGSSPNNTFTGEDGTYERFVKFDFTAGNAGNVQKPVGWRWASLIPDYSYTRDGKVLQSKNPLGIITSNLYGYDRNLVTATAVNASHREIGVEDFELRTAGSYSPSGRLPFISSNTLSVTNETAHTGNLCLKLNASGGGATGGSFNLPTVADIEAGSTYLTASPTLLLQAGKKYIVSFWIKLPSTAPMGANYTTLSLNSNPITELTASTQLVEGWRRIEGTFTAPASGTATLSILTFNSTSYIDDIRIHPFNAEMKTMIYDPVKYVPTVELDGRNYATFYVYDEEGKPVATKKETERGIYTVTHTRNNINR